MHRLSSILSTVLVVFGYGVLELVVADCPSDPLDKVRDCTSSILPELNTQALSDGPEASSRRIQVLEDSCTKSRLQDSANCIETILSLCRGNTDDEQLLRRLVDKEKTMATVDYFCEHLPVYKRHVDCISGHHDVTWACSQEAHKSFNTIFTAGAKMDVLIIGSCKFHGVARLCLTNTTRAFCGPEAAIFVNTVLTGMMPPYCEIALESDSVTYMTTDRWRVLNDSPRDGQTYDGPESVASTLQTTIPALIAILFCVVRTL